MGGEARDKGKYTMVFATPLSMLTSGSIALAKGDSKRRERASGGL
jgi:hypothetical protein